MRHSRKRFQDCKRLHWSSFEEDFEVQGKTSNKRRLVIYKCTILIFACINDYWHFSHIMVEILKLGKKWKYSGQWLWILRKKRVVYKKAKEAELYITNDLALYYWIQLCECDCNINKICDEYTFSYIIAELWSAYVTRAQSISCLFK